MTVNPNIDQIRSILSAGPSTESQIVQLTKLSPKVVRWILLWGAGFVRVQTGYRGNSVAWMLLDQWKQGKHQLGNRPAG